jgi:predicted acetyltransferase
VTLELRPITEEEWPAFAVATMTSFGTPPGDEELDPGRRSWELERSLATFDRGQIVGTTATFSFELTLPGLTVVPAAGVSWVGVLPSHRRQGILTGMMRRQLEDVHGRGEPVAVLLASESVIYGRFGYGAATTQMDVTLDRRHAGLARPAELAGRLVIADVATAAKVLPAVHDRCRRLRPGEVSRPDRYWKTLLSKAERPAEGAGRTVFVLYESASGEVDGYATYRVREPLVEGPNSDGTVVVQEISAVTMDAYIRLWQCVADVDLTTRLEARYRPLDEPLRWLLADPRRLVGTVADYLWARLVDLPVALSARRWASPGSLVLEVADPFCPWNEGRWLLEAGPDGTAACAPTDQPAQLRLGVEDLGAAYLGGVRLSTLARVGRVEEAATGALARADAMLACEPLPCCQTYF